jgi:outer membrane receptor protein involved in Fe transport
MVRVDSGHTVFDLGLARQIRRGIELNLSLDNLTNRDYYETQNYLESRVTSDGSGRGPDSRYSGYPLTAVVGMTIRLRGK